MRKTNVKPSLIKKVLLIVSLFLYSLILSSDLFSKKLWNRDYVDIGYQAKDTAIIIKFKFYDYAAVTLWTHAYFQSGDFAFSEDGVSYKKLMGCETYYQEEYTLWSNVYMNHKLLASDLRFYDCFVPKSGKSWNPDFREIKLMVFNKGHIATGTIKWFLHSTYANVKYIRVTGIWNVRGGFYCPQNITDEIYKVPVMGKQPEKSVIDNDWKHNNSDKMYINQTSNKTVNISAITQEIVIKGGTSKEKITVYTKSGAKIKTITTNDDVVKIKLPKNQMYIVEVGKARYKATL